MAPQINRDRVALEEIVTTSNDRTHQQQLQEKEEATLLVFETDTLEHQVFKKQQQQQQHCASSSSSPSWSSPPSSPKRFSPPRILISPNSLAMGRRMSDYPSIQTNAPTIIMPPRTYERSPTKVSNSTSTTTTTTTTTKKQQPSSHPAAAAAVATSSKQSSISSRRSRSKKPKHSSLVKVEPEPLRQSAWMEPAGSSFLVRGPNYLKDGGKKVPSAPSVFEVLTVDLIQCPTNVKLVGGICSHPNERIQQALKREQLSGGQTKEIPEFVFCVNIAVPAPPCYYHLCIYLGCDNVDLLKNNNTGGTANENDKNNSNKQSNFNSTSAFAKIAEPFFFGTNNDDWCSETFKLIPRVVEGNFLVKRAVASKPTILGKKLKQTYIRHPRFMEVIVDVGSNAVAEKIVGLTKNFAKTLEVEMAFLLEAKETSCLPERLLGSVRLSNIDFKHKDGKRVVTPP